MAESPIVNTAQDTSAGWIIALIIVVAVIGGFLWYRSAEMPTGATSGALNNGSVQVIPQESTQQEPTVVPPTDTNPTTDGTQTPQRPMTQ